MEIESILRSSKNTDYVANQVARIPKSYPNKIGDRSEIDSLVLRI